MKSLVICIALIFAGMSQNGFGCVLMGKSLSKFDDSEYVFIGKVVGYTDPVRFDDKQANASVEPLSSTDLNQTVKAPPETTGLIVKVVEIVHLPKSPVESFEVFPFNLMADCSIGGQQLFELRSRYPIDLEVRIIAKEAEFVPSINGKKVIRIEVRPSEPNHIITNLNKGIRMTSSSSFFSYKDYTYDMDSDSDSKYLLPAFEVRKDLLRLERAKTQPDRNSILDRLFHAPPNSDLDMSELFNTYAGSQAEADRLFESHLKATSPETYDAYTIVRQTLDELIKRGFDKKHAEEAVQKALSEGTEFESAKLVKRAAEILSPTKKRSNR
jgi:hypothetical protein